MAEECCCPHPDAGQCLIWRYRDQMPLEELEAEVRMTGGCECSCHYESYDEEGDAEFLASVW